MTDKKQTRIEELIRIIPSLTEGQIYWVERVVQIFNGSHKFKNLSPEFLDYSTLENFGDALRIHHGFSAEPFSKDKFEYVLEKVMVMSGNQASLAPKGNRGHDITINGIPFSLKTQADQNIREDRIWISKFMELGRGEWGDMKKI